MYVLKYESDLSVVAIYYRYGRRYPLLLAVFLQTVAGVSSAFAWNWISFTIIRFVLALSTGGTMITGFVITMEMVGVKHRQLFSMLFQVWQIFKYYKILLL